jgi:hypothetical protein
VLGSLDIKKGDEDTIFHEGKGGIFLRLFLSNKPCTLINTFTTVERPVLGSLDIKKGEEDTVF